MPCGNTLSPSMQSWLSLPLDRVLSNPYCFALAFPSATGLTASRWEGFGSSETLIPSASPYCNVGDATSVIVRTFADNKGKRCTKMTEDVPGNAQRFVHFTTALYFVEEGSRVVFQEPCKQIKAPSMGHSHDELSHASYVCVSNDPRERNETDLWTRPQIGRPMREAWTPRPQVHISLNWET